MFLTQSAVDHQRIALEKEAKRQVGLSAAFATYYNLHRLRATTSRRECRQERHRRAGVRWRTSREGRPSQRVATRTPGSVGPLITQVIDPRAMRLAEVNGLLSLGPANGVGCVVTPCRLMQRVVTMRSTHAEGSKDQIEKNDKAALPSATPHYEGAR